jgi:elongation factor Ts
VEISVEKVKELRNKTGAGMMDVKKALEESNGDFEKAIEYLRKKGSLTSQKRIEKIAKEGLILARTSSDRKEAAIVEVNCETDFVARSDAFQKFTNSIADVVFKSKTNDVKAILTNQIAGNLTVQQSLDELVGKVGEKVEIKRVDYFKSSDGFFCEYNHVGNKIASLVEISGNVTEQGIKLGNELAMQVVAMKPAALDRAAIDSKVIEKEKEIYLTQAKNEKKPDNIAEKIAANKVEKFFQENCLVEQEYMREPGKSVTDFIKGICTETGNDYKVKSFVRYQLGETLENK